MEQQNKISDREVYPALWITLAAMAAGYLLWLWAGRPTVSGCWFYGRLGVYCPGCGGTRALTALARGRLLQSLYYHPAVPYAAVTVGAYLISQTVWRLRGRRGRVLRYSDRWLWCLLAILAVNCLARNLLRFCFGIVI